MVGIHLHAMLGDTAANVQFMPVCPLTEYPLCHTCLPTCLPACRRVAALQLHQKLALRAVQAMRSGFDLATGYKLNKAMDEGHWLRRIIFLETVAGGCWVPLLN
jgi:hypothetical protein